MKLFLGVLTAITFACTIASAQNISTKTTTPTRFVRFKFITKDSVNLSLNDKYDLIEDSCTQIIRYGHLNMQQRKFFGKFKDVSKVNPQLIVSEGSYTADGLKDGAFISRYLNGNLQAKGNFKNNKFDGLWEMYYNDGKPKLTFEGNGNDIKIIDSWDAKGVKTLNNGKGNYRVNLGDLYWKGKLLDGKPDGTWKAIKTDDATEVVLSSETYKNGVFQKGQGPLGDYTDAPRLALIAPGNLPFAEAELLRVSAIACDGVNNFKHIVNAKYNGGFNSFTKHIQEVVEPYLSKINLTPYDSKMLLVDGEVDNTGKFVKFTEHIMFDETLVSGLIRQLYLLPFLEPATVDGKPVSQKITFTFTFNNGLYSFTYKFLPVEVK